jgi:hypothetical protein
VNPLSPRFAANVANANEPLEREDLRLHLNTQSKLIYFSEINDFGALSDRKTLEKIFRFAGEFFV